MSAAVGQNACSGLSNRPTAARISRGGYSKTLAKFHRLLSHYGIGEHDSRYRDGCIILYGRLHRQWTTLLIVFSPIAITAVTIALLLSRDADARLRVLKHTGVSRGQRQEGGWGRDSYHPQKKNREKCQQKENTWPTRVSSIITSDFPVRLTNKKNK